VYLVIGTDRDDKMWLLKNPEKVADFHDEHVSVKALATNQNAQEVKSIEKAKATEQQ
jgi:hypothetical protein